MASPEFSAQTIFRIVDPNAWIEPAAIPAPIFCALAGGKHVMNAGRTASENWAMGSDLWAALVLAAFLIAIWIRRP